jgi:L-asparaginase II
MNLVPSYSPIYALTRGEVIESLHDGAIVVVDVNGELVAWYGDPEAVTFLRSSAKPFQALPFLAHGGKQAYGLSDREVAIMCASHSGTDEHVQLVNQIQQKTGVREDELLCGVHFPIHKPTAEALRERQEQPTPNSHNCSGKHTGMLAFTRLLDEKEAVQVDNLPYIDPSHPIQQEILSTFALMCGLPVEGISRGVDGCSAPIFAAPLRNVALGYARLCDPDAGGIYPPALSSACNSVTSAMIANPDMVGGPERFDTVLMGVGRGRFIAKGGAEAFQGVGLMPGVLGPGSPAAGIAIKVADGDKRASVGAAVTIETLDQLGVLTPQDREALSAFNPRHPVKNWRKLTVGQAYPLFSLNFNESGPER